MEKEAVYIARIDELTYRNFKGVKDINFLKNENEIYPWTIFLGNNGTGKTNLLKLLSSIEPVSDKMNNKEGDTALFFIPKFYDNDHSHKTKLLYKKELYKWGAKINQGAGDRNYQTELAFGDFQIYSYGVNRRSSSKSKLTKSKPPSNNQTLFNHNVSLLDLDEWLMQTDYAEKNGQSGAEKRLELIRKVITGEIFPEISDFRFKTNEDLDNFVEFETKEGWFQLEDLAYGYQSTLSWIVDFCKKMFDRYPGSINPLKEPAIVLIDEIDLHLHPSWQRNITKILSNLFPKTQFIATTHSPLVVQSLEEANVYVLNKGENGVTVNRMPNDSFTGWSVEDILNKVMGLESKVKSDEYLKLIKKFDDGLDKRDYESSKSAYDKLMNILPANDTQKTVLSMQIKQFPKAR